MFKTFGQVSQIRIIWNDKDSEAVRFDLVIGNIDGPLLPEISHFKLA